MKNSRRLGLSGIVLAAALLKMGCSRMLDDATLIVNLPKGPYTYSILIENENAGDMHTSESGEMWVDWGETESSFKINPGQSYKFKAIGFLGYRITQDGRLQLLRRYSKEEPSVCARAGETCEIDITMKDETEVIEPTVLGSE